MSLHLEERLRGLADELEAPPSDTALRAVGRRARVMRRRRRARRAAAGGVLVAGLVVGVFAVRAGTPDGEPGTVATDPDGATREAALPAWTLDLDGWEAIGADEGDDSASDEAEGSDWRGSLQVFRRPGELAGPTLAVRHVSASDAFVPADDDEPVMVGDVQGYIRRLGPDRFVLSWSLGDSHVELRAFGVPEPDVHAFAGGLVPRDPDGVFSFPGDGDQLGFDATELPPGLDEDRPAADRQVARYRGVVFGDGRSQVTIQVDGAGERFFEDTLVHRLVHDRAVEEIEVDGHRAVSLETSDWERHVLWLQDDATVHVTIEGLRSPSVEDVVAGLRQISEDEWRALRARLG